MEKRNRLEQAQAKPSLRRHHRGQRRNSACCSECGQVLAEFLIAFLVLSSFLFYIAGVAKLFEKKNQSHQFPAKQFHKGNSYAR